MKPGATAQPDASSSRSPRRFGPISRIDAVGDRDVGDATGRAAAVEDRSAADDDVSRHLSSLSRIDHELEQVAVGVAHVHARRVGAGGRPARATGPSTISAPASSSSACQRLRRCRPTRSRGRRTAASRSGARSVKPSRCQVAGRWKLIIWSPTYTDTTCGCSATSKPERAVERDHRVGVLHRQRHVVEAGDRPVALRSSLMREAVQPGAVGRGDLAAVVGGQRAERLLDRAPRVRERAVGVRIVRRPHARVGAEERDELRARAAPPRTWRSPGGGTARSARSSVA